jgi:hypothetical protein
LEVIGRRDEEDADEDEIDEDDEEEEALTAEQMGMDADADAVLVAGLDGARATGRGRIIGKADDLLLLLAARSGFKGRGPDDVEG